MDNRESLHAFFAYADNAAAYAQSSVCYAHIYGFRFFKGYMRPQKFLIFVETLFLDLKINNESLLLLAVLCKSQLGRFGVLQTTGKRTYLH